MQIQYIQHIPPHAPLCRVLMTLPELQATCLIWHQLWYVTPLDPHTVCAANPAQETLQLVHCGRRVVGFVRHC